MSFYNSKEEFSTGADQRESKGYSSRFSRAKSKKGNNKDILPYYQEKAALVIQKWWRHRMYLRRIFYQNLYEQIYYHNQAAAAIVKQKQIFLNSIEKENEGLEKMNKIKIQAKTQQTKALVKNLAKDCVGLTFKMEKRMVTQKQLGNLVAEKIQLEQTIESLQKQKQHIQFEIVNNLGENEQILLREIKQANAQLLKIVSQKNSLKHKLRQQAINCSITSQ